MTNNNAKNERISEMAGNTFANDIASHLRRKILRGELPPGASIKERDNAVEMGVSRTPMREAIRILAKEGLVILRPSRSPIVATLNVKDVADQVEVLVALEKLSAELSCVNATDADFRKIEAIVRRMEEQFYLMDPLDMFEIDMSFHKAIADASKNRALAETHSTYMQRLWYPRYLAAKQRRNRERVVSEHSSILSAMRTRDVVAARAAIDKHLLRLSDDVRTQIDILNANKSNCVETERSTAPNQG